MRRRVTVGVLVCIMALSSFAPVSAHFDRHDRDPVSPWLYRYCKPYLGLPIEDRPLKCQF